MGCIRDKKPEGIGIQILNEGKIFIGNFKNGKLNGFGRKIEKNGKQFIGKFFGGVKDNKGYAHKGFYSNWELFNKSI